MFKLFVLFFAIFVCSSSFADQPVNKKKNFQKNHPRRAEVLGRANNEEKKNEKAEEAGKITEQQEKHLNQEDEKIKREEERDAAKHGGHITKKEQRKLNREENAVNRERARDEKADAVNPPAGNQ